MALPEKIRVKLNSEEAAFVSITPVVVRDMPLRDLVELMLGVTGKDVSRIHELLLRGTLVSGASRFRWNGWDADRENLEAMLATFPDPDPGRAFSAEHCIRVVLCGPGLRLDLAREAAAKRRFLRKENFWDILVKSALHEPLDYLKYSYKDRADLYRLNVSLPLAARIRASAGLLTYSSMAATLRKAALETLTFFVERPLT